MGEVRKMVTYKKLYYDMVSKMDQALTCCEEGNSILACHIMQKALLDSEEAIISQDIILDEPFGSEQSDTAGQ